MGAKVGVIGPTDILKFCKLMNKPKEYLLLRAKIIGRALAESGCELWVNSDKGMLVAVARAYKEADGEKLVVLYPENGEPWPNNHASPYVKGADEIRKERNWFWSNYNVVSLVDLSVCVGLSTGTLSELAYIKWNYQLKCGILKRLIGIRELLREGRFPPEIEIDISDIIRYIKADNLKDFIINKGYALLNVGGS